MSLFPESLQQLISALSRLPGIGPRSAERLALYLALSDPAVVESLAATLKTSRSAIQTCSECGALTEKNPCHICDDPRRDHSLICVVERPTDIFTLEKAGRYRGVYHVLGGKISPINGVEAADLRIPALKTRIAQLNKSEVIIALPTDVEGDATSYYLAHELSSDTCKITRIAHGLPAGAGLEFADEVTITHALEGRREIK